MSLFVDVPAARDRWQRALAEALPGHAIVDDPSAARYALVWRHAHGLFARMPALEAVFVLGAGVEQVLADPSLPAAVPVFRLRDAGMAAQMADYVVHAARDFQRDFDRDRADEGRQRWRPRAPSPALRVGMLGFGAIAEVVAAALIARGFEVRAWARRARVDRRTGVEVSAGPEALDALLAQTQLVVGLLPETPATIGLLDRRRLAALPRGAAIVNVGRGSLIDEAALVELLDAGHLRGAVLDVTAVEPLPPDDPLWRHPAVRLTPHVAAKTLIDPAVAQIAATVAALERGQALPPSVDRDAGY